MVYSLPSRGAMRTEEVAGTYAEWGEPLLGEADGDGEQARPEVPCTKEDWICYMTPWIEHMWRGMIDVLDCHAVPLLDRADMADFVEFCWNNSNIRAHTYYSNFIINEET